MAESPKKGLNTRQRLALTLFIPFLLWQSVVAACAVFLSLFYSRVLRLPVWYLLGLGLLSGLLTWLYVTDYSFPSLIQAGFNNNFYFWRLFLQGEQLAAFSVLAPWLFGFTPLMAACFSLIDLVPTSAHERSLRALQKGQADSSVQEMSSARLERILALADEAKVDGTLLGVSYYCSQLLVIPDSHVNQIVLVLGTTGGGKTVTLRRFYHRALAQGYPLIIVDGKPTDENVTWVQQFAQRYQRPFYGFNCGSFDHYDPLAQGGYTELKDKIISLKDEWESDYYRSIAEDYLQTAIEVLLALQEPFDLKTVVDALDYETLVIAVRQLKDESLMKRVQRLAHYERKDITGLQAHLNLLIHSELGIYFEHKNRVFNLPGVIQGGGGVYFALPALRFPAFSKVLGKLVINDIKAVVDRLDGKQPIFTVFDEFSVFAGEQVLNLVNMGRGKGVHAVFGTQGLADLTKIDKTFNRQILNCANTVICHRLNDQESAEEIATWIGTRDAFDVTAQIDATQGTTGLGSVKRNKAFMVHPDDIKQRLQPGDAFYATKVGQFKRDKVKVKWS